MIVQARKTTYVHQPYKRTSFDVDISCQRQKEKLILFELLGMTIQFVY